MEIEKKLATLPEKIDSVWELPFSTCEEQLLEAQF